MDTISHLTGPERDLYLRKQHEFGLGRSNIHRYGEQAFWLKGQEAEEAKLSDLRVILRLDDRSRPEVTPEQWLPTFLPIPVYFIEVPGDHVKGILPKFLQDDGTTVVVEKRVIKPLGDIVDDDLYHADGWAVPLYAEDVPKYLEEMFSPGIPISKDRLVTIYYVRYIAKQIPASDTPPV